LIKGISMKPKHIAEITVLLAAIILTTGCIQARLEQGISTSAPPNNTGECFYSNDIRNIGSINAPEWKKLDENFSLRFLHSEILNNTPQICGGQLVEPKEDHTLVNVEFELSNNGKEYRSISFEKTSWGQFTEIEGDDGIEYHSEYSTLTGPINPGDVRKIDVCTWIPKKVTPTAFLLGGYRNPAYCSFSSFEKVRATFSSSTEKYPSVTPTTVAVVTGNDANLKAILEFQKTYQPISYNCSAEENFSKESVYVGLSSMLEFIDGHNLGNAEAWVHWYPSLKEGWVYAYPFGLINYGCTKLEKAKFSIAMYVNHDDKLVFSSPASELMNGDFVGYYIYPGETDLNARAPGFKFSESGDYRILVAVKYNGKLAGVMSDTITIK